MHTRFSTFCATIGIIGLSSANFAAADAPTVATQVVQATTMLRGKNSTATCFLVTRPGTANPGRQESILITAGHVLEAMESDDAGLLVRKTHADGTYDIGTMSLKVRAKGKPLWTKHPKVDVAVLSCHLPDQVAIVPLPVGALATESAINDSKLTLAGAVRFAGYPFKVTSVAGFPTVRHGTVASFPLLPVKKYKSYLLDCNTFEGDSGGPVFVDQPHVGSEPTKPERQPTIVGMVFGRGSDPDTKTEMHLAAVVHAQYIRETIDLLK
jgi:Trypsin-like peptidase domain